MAILGDVGSVRIPGKKKGILQLSEFDPIVILEGSVNASPDLQIDRTLDNQTLISMFGPGLRQAQFMGIAPTCDAGGTTLASIRSRIAKEGMRASLTFDGTSYRGVVTGIQTTGQSSGGFEGLAQTTIQMLVEAL